MGGGSYSFQSRSLRAESLGYNHKPAEEIFEQRGIHSEMNPYGITVRESRDSVEHPETIAIIIALDETGSMGKIPHELIKNGLPTIMERIISSGILHPQVLFLGVGDHLYDHSPIQVGQFESSDELLDYWLTKVYLEGKGGGNGGESYSLAHYVAGFHTSIDCFEKRNQKGILFTIGDENNHSNYSQHHLKNLFRSCERSYTSKELIKKAKEKYHVFHINLDSSSSSHWKQLLGEGCIDVHNYTDIPEIIAKTILSVYGPTLTEVSDFNNQEIDESKDNSQKINIL